MYCATTLSLKVCSSVTTAVNAAAGSCGTYKFINVPTIDTALTVCPANSMALYTALETQSMLTSPFNLTVSEGAQISFAILMALTVAYCGRIIIDYIKPKQVLED